jgi:hypothetical protein
VLGVFAVLLGAGVIFDADRTISGTLLMLTGAALLVLESRQP